LREVCNRYDMGPVARGHVYRSASRLTIARAARDGHWGAVEAVLVQRGILSQWDIDLSKA
ncbi:MAG: hypothetical protein ABW067_17410, partial [Rhizobacter sp.]